MADSTFVVGIDLGTTNTVVASAPLSGGAATEVAIPQLVAPNETAALPQLPSALYLPTAAELPADALRLPWSSGAQQPDAGPVVVVGRYARAQGAKVPGRLVASAKSWLSWSGVDREAAILPWGAADGVPRLSPVDASARVLAHVRASWDHAHPEAPLAAQEVVLTVPASFDEVARELTLKAAAQAGLPALRLIEEPAAAFLSLAQGAGTGDAKLVLVVDVGGGTTDLTLVRVERDPGQPQRFVRIAVGEHLMLGGDNMDVTLARHVEQELIGAIGSLDGASWSALVEASRIAKEALLDDDAPETYGVALVGRGSKLVGGARTYSVERERARTLLLDGFFPAVESHEVAARRPRTALAEFGLPYAHDPAITRHIATFLRRHHEAAGLAGAHVSGGIARPDAVLLNGGAFHSPRVRARLLEVLSSWFPGAPVPMLAHASLDAAVARGAVASGLARHGRGVSMGGGSARAYFVGVQTPEGERALCVVPHGMVEGSTHEVERTFHLTLGKPVSFPLYSSTTSSTATTSAVGLLVKGEDLEPLPPLQAVLQQRDEVPVRLRATLTEVGTLELSLQMMPEALDRFGLTFSTRAASDATAKPGAASSEPIAARIDEAKDMVAAYFGNKSKDVDPKGVKNLRRDLEKMLGAREQWSTAVNRELAGTLLAGSARRRRSAEHERAFFQLLGWCMRPGFGAPFDEWRVSELWPLFAEGVQHVSEKPTWASWWILWRRIAGGLDADKQRAIHDATAPWLLQQGTGKPGKGPTPHGQDEMVRLLASLERLPAAAKEELGRFVVKKLGRGGITSYWPLGRLGARQPLAGSAHDVVPAAVAAEWLKKVLEADLKTAEGAAFATVELARLTGDRARDLDVALREAAAVRLEKADRPSWARMLREVVPLSLEDEATAFGDALPVGLKLGP